MTGKLSCHTKGGRFCISFQSGRLFINIRIAVLSVVYLSRNAFIAP